jgi:hypothetical protein
MINQRHCPYCKAAATAGCPHLALAVEARDFVTSCIQHCHGQALWPAVCQRRHEQRQLAGEWSREQEDFTWLETAFCDQFLKHLRWFGGLDHEWRSGPKPEQGGFWVLLWSQEPRRLWWELRDELEKANTLPSLISPQAPTPSLIWLTPR